MIYDSYDAINLSITGGRVTDEIYPIVSKEVVEWLRNFKGLLDEHGYPAELEGRPVLCIL